VKDMVYHAKQTKTVSNLLYDKGVFVMVFLTYFASSQPSI